MRNHEKDNEVLRRHYAELLEEMAELKKSKWVKCSEQMPPSSEKVLIRINKEGVKLGLRFPFEPMSEPIDVDPGYSFHWKDMEVASYIEDSWYGTKSNTHKDAVTHWMALPEPPEE